MRPKLTVGIVTATAIMYLRIAVEIALFNRPLAWLLPPRVAALSALAGSIAAWQWRHRQSVARPSAGELPVMNPLRRS